MAGAAAAVPAVAAAAGAAAGAAPPLEALAVFLIPPWPLQAPRPPWGEVVPSLQTTGPPLVEDEADAAAGAVAAAGAAAGAVPPLEAALFTPPCPLQAPRPECVEVVPSLQTTGPPPLEGEELAAAGAAAGALAAAGVLVELPLAELPLAEADLFTPP